jgi:hypothetical protein
MSLISLNSKDMHGNELRLERAALKEDLIIDGIGRKKPPGTTTLL